MCLQDVCAFEQMNRRFRPGLMAYFLRRLRNHAEAEDLTQEVFVRLVAANPKKVQSAEAYIFQVAANLLRDRSRREKVRFEYLDAAMSEEGVGVDALDPQRVSVARESLAAMAAALRELPERERSIFMLYRLENVSKRDIADVFQVSLSTLERCLARAMAHLAVRVGRAP